MKNIVLVFIFAFFAGCASAPPSVMSELSKRGYAPAHKNFFTPDSYTVYKRANPDIYYNAYFNKDENGNLYLTKISSH